MWNDTAGTPSKKPRKIVYINKKRILRKVSEKVIKDQKKIWRIREKNENIRLLQMPLPNIGDICKRNN